MSYAPGIKDVCPKAALVVLPSSLVLSSLRRSPMAVSVAHVPLRRLRGALVLRVVLVGHARVRMRWVVVSVRFLLPPLFLFAVCWFLSPSLLPPSLSLSPLVPLSLSSLPQPVLS